MEYLKRKLQKTKIQSNLNGRTRDYLFSYMLMGIDFVHKAIIKLHCSLRLPTYIDTYIHIYMCI